MEEFFLKAAWWVASIAGFYFMFRGLFNGSFKPTIFYKGWGSLYNEYRSDFMPIDAEKTSIRIGAEVYNETCFVAFNDKYVYLKTPSLFNRSTIRIPYSDFVLISQPTTQMVFLFKIPVYGIFKVKNVDIWMEKKFSEIIIKRLNQ